jgi:RimJ/RimL family protein N-acetyltransferase
MSLTTSRLILRRWRDTDLSEFARLNDDLSPMAKSRLRRF